MDRGVIVGPGVGALRRRLAVFEVIAIMGLFAIGFVYPCYIANKEKCSHLDLTFVDWLGSFGSAKDTSGLSKALYSIAYSAGTVSFLINLADLLSMSWTLCSRLGFGAILPIFLATGLYSIYTTLFFTDYHSFVASTGAMSGLNGALSAALLLNWKREASKGRELSECIRSFILQFVLSTLGHGATFVPVIAGFVAGFSIYRFFVFPGSLLTRICISWSFIPFFISDMQEYELHFLCVRIVILVVITYLLTLLDRWAQKVYKRYQEKKKKKLPS